jgi:PTS system beta-glucosides-specific IIC component
MSNKNFNELAKALVENVGGVSNISECYHCMSRLRVKIKDTSKANLAELKKLGFTDVVLNGNQVQVIAGNDVYDIYDAVIGVAGKDIGLGELDQAAEAKHEKLTVKSAIWAFFGGISNSVQPCIPVLIGAGVLQGLYLIFAQIGILSTESSTYTILTAVCNAPFYFFPIFVGFNCAKQYGGNQLLGAFLGAMLVHPTFVNLVTAGNPITFLGIPVRAVNYTSSVLPAFVSVWAMCYVEKFVAKHSPKSVRVVLEPFITVLVMVPLTLWILAPIGDYLGIGLGVLITWIYNVAGPFAPAILAAFIPFLVLTGTHSIIGTLAVATLVAKGKESIMMPGALIHNFNHGALSLAIGLKTKNRDLKSTALSSSFTALVGGISEPSLFGLFAKYKSAMVALLAGQFVSGLYCGFTGTGIYAFPAGGPAFLQLAAFLGGPTSNFVNAVIATLLGMAVTFAVAFISFNDKDITA